MCGVTRMHFGSPQAIGSTPKPAALPNDRRPALRLDPGDLSRRFQVPHKVLRELFGDRVVR